MCGNSVNGKRLKVVVANLCANVEDGDDDGIVGVFRNDIIHCPGQP